MIRNLRKNKRIKLLITFVCVIVAAFLQAYVIQVFIQPADLLSSGFTGVRNDFVKCPSSNDLL